MIYLFSWENNFLLQEDIKKWKSVFIEKNGDFNFVHIKDILSVDKNYLSEILLWQSLFWWKKEIIIEWYPLSTIKKNETAEDEEKEENDIDTFFLSILLHIPEDNIVIFVNNNPDKRTKIYKKIIEIGQQKLYPFFTKEDIVSFVLKRYNSQISEEAADLLSYYKWSNLEKVINDIEKLLLYTKKIELHDIKNNIVPEIEENIFILVDNILNKKIKEAVKEIRNMLLLVNVYALYNSLLANIRNRVYIEMLLHMHVSQTVIADRLSLGNKTFLIGKKYAIDFKSLEWFYRALIELDKKMKFWHMKGSEDEDFLYELEKTMIQYLS